MLKSRITWLLFLLVILVQVWAFFNSDNGIDLHHNAFDRQIFVADWVERGGLIPDPAYPPLHFYILAALRLVTPDLQFAPRLLSLLCGLLAFWPLVLLTRRLFGERAGDWAGLGYAVFPLGVRAAVLSLAVAPYLLFLALGLERLSKAWAGRKIDAAAAVWGGFFITLACATRFDAWAFLPVMAAVAVWRDRRRGWLVALVACLFPLVWMASQWRIYHDPLHFLSISGGISALHMVKLSLVERVFAWPQIVFFALGPLVGVASIFGLIIAGKKKTGLWLIGIFAFGLAVFIWRTAHGTFGTNETKYAAALGLMLLPLAGLALETMRAKVADRWRPVAALVVGAFILTAGVAQIRAENIRFQADPDLAATAGWLAEHRDGRAAIIGTRNQGYLIIHGQVPKADRLLAQTSDETGRIDVDHLRTMFDRSGEKLLVYDVLPDGLDFHNILQLKQGSAQEKMGHAFTPLFTQGAYTVFAVE